MERITQPKPRFGKDCPKCGIGICDEHIMDFLTAAPVPQEMPAQQEPKFDRSGLKEACQRALALGRTHQTTDIQLFLDMLLEIERYEHRDPAFQKLVEALELIAPRCDFIVDRDRGTKCGEIAVSEGSFGFKYCDEHRGGRELVDAGVAVREALHLARRGK